MGRGGDLKAVAESTSASALDPERDTFPKLVRDNARRRPDKVAIREKDFGIWQAYTWSRRSEEHTSELQSRFDLVCRLLLEKKKHLTPRHARQQLQHLH